MIDEAAACAAVAERPAGLHADRDRQIFAAVLELLREIGYERMTIDAVANRARVSKATIYRRWPGKPQMVADALRHQKFEVHVPADTGTLRGDLLAMVHAVARLCAADLPLMLAVVFAMRSNAELARLMREHVLPAARMQTDSIIDRAVARGEIAPDDKVRELFHGLAPALLTSRLAADGLPIDDEYLQRVVDHVLLPVLTH
ncbi:MAG: TetR/AcrR family transcriptional regulator [Micromonosporaceae bacterium]|nr:TetR/AcrR family transcriptional regulator [Micromonosporaceae bacterium]